MTVGGPGTEVNNTVFYLMPAPGKGSPLAGHDLMITRTSYNLYACMHPMSSHASCVMHSHDLFDWEHSKNSNNNYC